MNEKKKFSNFEYKLTWIKLHLGFWMSPIVRLEVHKDQLLRRGLKQHSIKMALKAVREIHKFNKDIHFWNFFQKERCNRGIPFETFCYLLESCLTVEPIRAPTTQMIVSILYIQVQNRHPIHAHIISESKSVLRLV